jgi:hypothetical protein
MISARAITLAGMWLGAGLSSALADGGYSEPGPMQVMTDTPEYCWHLAAEVAEARRAAPVTPPPVRVLAEEGQRMCGSGMIRGGILRLRRALLLLKNEP